MLWREEQFLLWWCFLISVCENGSCSYSFIIQLNFFVQCCILQCWWASSKRHTANRCYCRKTSSDFLWGVQALPCRCSDSIHLSAVGILFPSPSVCCFYLSHSAFNFKETFNAMLHHPGLFHKPNIGFGHHMLHGSCLMKHNFIFVFLNCVF